MLRFEQGSAVSGREDRVHTAVAGALEPNQMANFKPSEVGLTRQLGGAVAVGWAMPVLRLKLYLELDMVLTRGNTEFLEVHWSLDMMADFKLFVVAAGR